MQVYRKKMANGKYSPSYYYSVVVNGRRTERSTKIKNRVKAQQWVDTHISREVESFQLTDCWQIFLHAPKESKPTSLQEMKSQWGQFLLWTNVKRTDQVTESVACMWWAHMDGQPKSYRTKNRYLSTIQRVLRASDNHSFTELPKWQKPKAERHEYRGRDPFTPDQVATILSHTDHYCYPMFAIGLATGLRGADIVNLQWSEIDLGRRCISIVQRKTGVPLVVPISSTLHNYLNTLPRTSNYVLPVHQRDKSYSHHCGVFLSKVCGFEISRKIEGRARRVPMLGIHSCRHTFSYFAEQAGVPLTIVQSIVGHNDIKMTAHYSSHGTLNQKLDAVERLGLSLDNSQAG